jgi:hypothetical protein
MRDGTRGGAPGDGGTGILPVCFGKQTHAQAGCLCHYRPASRFRQRHNPIFNFHPSFSAGVEWIFPCILWIHATGKIARWSAQFF